MRTETEIRRRLVYLLQQKGFLMQEISEGKKLRHSMRALMKEIEENTVETKVLQWILKMED